MTVKNGDVFAGIFWGAVMENQDSTYLLKMVHQVKSAKSNGANGVRDPPQEYLGTGEDHAMSFDTREVINLTVEGATLAGQDKHYNGKRFPIPSLGDAADL